ncbi:hypothetical protein ACEQ8H_004338 [Pleosporales sp. CAS-2024a]
MPPTRTPDLYAAALIPYTAAAIALALRMLARRKTRIRLVWEDYLAIAAFCIGTGFTFISLFKMRWGFGKHLADLGADTDSALLDRIEYHAHLDLFVDMWFYTFSVGMSKFVILGFYWRTFSRSLIRQPIKCLFALSALWVLLRVVLIAIQCNPIRSVWDGSVGYCPVKPMQSAFTAGILHLVIEVLILLCPLLAIWRLHMAPAKKVAISLMFAAGVVVCVSALLTVVFTVKLAKTQAADFTWDDVDEQMWAMCDVNLASFSTSLPLLRPVFRSFGGVFRGLRSTAAPPTHDPANPDAAPTFGSIPVGRTRGGKRDETESEIEFASEGSSKAYALHDMSPPESLLEAGDGIHVHTETVVKYAEV